LLQPAPCQHRTTYDYGLTKQGEEFIVMELIDGMGLNFLIETRSPQLEQSRIDLLLQITDGLEFLHQQVSCHRDMCPATSGILRRRRMSAKHSD